MRNLIKKNLKKKVSEEHRLITKGIEVGHIFYFGDKYSKPMGASVDLPGGKKDFVKMGSYGIGVSRLVGAIIEAKYDEKNEVMTSFFSSYLASIMAPTNLDTPIPYDPILTKSFFPPGKSTDAPIGFEYLSPK